MPYVSEEELAEKTSTIALVVLFIFAWFMGYQLLGPLIASATIYKSDIIRVNSNGQLSNAK